MKIKMSGVISVSVEDEWLFDGQPLPVSFVCDFTEETADFDGERVKLNFNVPVELAIAENEWSRAVGEVLARAIQPQT